MKTRTPQFSLHKQNRRLLKINWPFPATSRRDFFTIKVKTLYTKKKYKTEDKPKYHSQREWRREEKAHATRLGGDRRVRHLGREKLSSSIVSSHHLQNREPLPGRRSIKISL